MRRRRVLLPNRSPCTEQLGELPRTYGEKTLYLIARDPHWLFTYWDFDWSEFPGSLMLNGESKFFLNVRCGADETRIQINPEARNWYVAADKAGASYVAEIGYLTADGSWQTIVASNETSTPSDVFSEIATTEFATVPFHLNFQRLVEMVKATMATGESLIEALSKLQGEGRRSASDLNDEQRGVLGALVGEDLASRIGMGSAEIDQLLRKHLEETVSSGSAIAEKGRLMELLLQSESSWGGGESSLFGASWGAAAGWSGSVGSSWSAQPFGASAERQFFMHVNAEVIFYGGTHPDATVWIDGKQVPLQPDGTFRYHFKFPDGNYQIPIVAQSPDKVEQRSATLSLDRDTTRQGDVGHTAQPGGLEKPLGQRR